MTRTVKLNSVCGLQQQWQPKEKKKKKKKRVWTSQLVPEWLTVVWCFIISGWMYRIRYMAHIFNPQWAYSTSVRSNNVVCAVDVVFNRENVIYWSKCWRNEEEKIAFWLMVSFAWQLLADWIENQSCRCSSVNACKWAFQSALITYVKKDFTACESHFSFSLLFLLAGQIQEVSLSQEETAAQVEVTPELDLEVVPESSGDWHNVFHWLHTTRVKQHCTVYWALIKFYNWTGKLCQTFPPPQRGCLVEDIMDLVRGTVYPGLLPSSQSPAVYPN